MFICSSDDAAQFYVSDIFIFPLQKVDERKIAISFIALQPIGK